MAYQARIVAVARSRAAAVDLSTPCLRREQHHKRREQWRLRREVGRASKGPVYLASSLARTTSQVTLRHAASNVNMLSRSHPHIASVRTVSPVASGQRVSRQRLAAAPVAGQALVAFGLCRQGQARWPSCASCSTSSWGDAGERERRRRERRRARAQESASAGEERRRARAQESASAGERERRRARRRRARRGERELRRARRRRARAQESASTGEREGVRTALRTAGRPCEQSCDGEVKERACAAARHGVRVG
jgi:hypothetical protein